MAAKDVLAKRKKRKPNKSEIRTKLVDSIPMKQRWWTVWECEPSHTVASIASELPSGGSTEEIWNARKFESNIKKWMSENRDMKHLAAGVFSK